MKTLIFYIGLALTCATILNSCTRKEGCTDPSAINYCEDCKKSDGSCIYQGSMVFWWKQNFATHITSYGSIRMKVYLNEKYTGEVYLYKSGGQLKHWTSAPVCNDKDAITITKNLYETQTMQARFEFVCAGGSCLISKTAQITFSPNSCNSYEIK